MNVRFLYFLLPLAIIALKYFNPVICNFPMWNLKHIFYSITLHVLTGHERQYIIYLPRYAFCLAGS